MIVTNRKRNKFWKSILIAATLGTTLPILALLCRGHSPSRFDVDNLPSWERVTPIPPMPLGRQIAVPIPSSKIRFDSLPVADTLMGADENKMFANLETARGLPESRLDAGKPGVWLEQAAVLARWDPAILPKMDRIAGRLMNDQDSGGYLGAVTHIRAYTAQDIAAHSNNLRGLLAYYEVTRQPAAVYSAIRAGDFLLESYDPWPGHEQPGAEDSLVYALTQLYRASGAGEFLQFAEREEATRGCDGLGLCALYEATGDAHYLTLAKQCWSETGRKREVVEPENGGSASIGLADFSGYHANFAVLKPTPQFSAEIYQLTGNPKYLNGLRGLRATSVWPISVAYTRSARGLSVNEMYPASIDVGRIHLKISCMSDETAERSAAAPSSRPRGRASGRVAITAVDERSATTPRPASRNVEIVHRSKSTTLHDTPATAVTVELSTAARTAQILPIDFQPGCIDGGPADSIHPQPTSPPISHGRPAKLPARQIQINVNGKRVNYDPSTAIHLALKAVPMKRSAPSRPTPHTEHGAKRLTPEA